MENVVNQLKCTQLTKQTKKVHLLNSMKLCKNADAHLAKD